MIFRVSGAGIMKSKLAVGECSKKFRPSAF